jgi:hypothetical protein
MLEITAATEGETDHRPAIGTSTLDQAVRDEFEAIWRIAGLPPADLSRHRDGTYKAAHAMHAWDMYAATRDWHAVLAAAKEREFR